jgi:periplasmic divalent cation tolerance protein
MKADLYIGLTTCETEDDAISLIDKLLEKSLIACGQIDGPIHSKYSWGGEIKSEKEWRVTLKFKISAKSEVLNTILIQHKYDNPEWVCHPAESTEKYATWVNQVTQEG